MKKLRIFLADDHAVFRQGLTMLINAQPDMEVVGEARDGQEVIQQAPPLQPDVVVMDVSMPTVDGAQATEHLKQACPATKVLALTAYEEGKRVRQLLKAGVSGYLLKRVAADELTHAIRTVAAGGIYLDPTVAGKVVEGYLQKSVPLDDDVESSTLSGRESDVMRLLAWAYSNKEIAAHLGLSVKTVETYKARLMEKLRLQSRVDIVRYAVRHGWLQEP
ncbi:MAG TPA: response regulator transcription factor [Candidatus Tectomicrobia bacterium]|jgi:DNA-binding NarL/FixJ family response regulator